MLKKKACNGQFATRNFTILYLQLTVDAINIMKHQLFKHSLLVCVLWLLTCCTGAASEDYRRTMWVSTTGEDSPQCIHDTPTSDPVPHPRHLNESCRSLNYALTHIQNVTFIVIACGTYELKPVNKLLDGVQLLNITGSCFYEDLHDQPKIQCTDGANLELHNLQRVVFTHLAFQGCGKQMQQRDSSFSASTLYFQDSLTVTMYHVDIDITSSYGTGISLIYRESTTTNREVVLDTVKVDHHGINGNGIHFELHTDEKTNVNRLGMKIRLNDVRVNGEFSPQILNLAQTFSGINISVMGHGEGGEIALTKVNVRDSGIVLALLDTVHDCKVSLRDSVVSDTFSDSFSTMPKSGSTITESPSNGSKYVARRSTTYSRVKIELRDKSVGNHIQIENVLVIQKDEIPGSAISIKITDHSESNTVLLEEVELRGPEALSENSRGLQITVTGWARRNQILATDLQSWRHRAGVGAAAYIEFSGHAMRNVVRFKDGIFCQSFAIRGGGIAIVYREFATHNIFKMDHSHIYDNNAELGGGVYFRQEDSSNNNTIWLQVIVLLNNTAHSGGGMFIQFQDSSIANRIEMVLSMLAHNALLPSKKYDMMGGGVHVDFSTVSANVRTDNIISFTRCLLMLNRAAQGVGGGISVLSKTSRYQGDNGNEVILYAVVFLKNMAVSGSACAFQSLPTHGKRLFRGVRVVQCYMFPHLSLFQIVNITDPFRMPDQFTEDYLIAFLQTSIEIIKQQLPQTITPSLRVETNTNMIFAQSVQITAGNLDITCGASSQGMYAIDTEIVLQPSTHSVFQLCVATHGGAIALYGESYIRVAENAILQFHQNYAFQRGGAIYASSPPCLVPVPNCFLQFDVDQDWERKRSSFVFRNNSAKAEGQSVYVTDIRKCLSQRIMKNNTSISQPHQYPQKLSLSLFDVLYFNFTTACQSNNCSGSSPWKVLRHEIVSGPSHVGSEPGDLDKPVGPHFIPGKQKRLPFTHVYDELGSTVSTLFIALISKMDHSVPTQLDPLSIYTTDFTVILHGIPKQHGMANHSFLTITANTSNSEIVQSPQLVLWSVENTHILLVMNIVFQCCPPGYIFRYGSGDMGTCHCGKLSMLGIADCNESQPEVIGAVLERDHWAGYVPSNDQHSCDEQKFFTGPCPPGYCQTQQITLPQNNSQQALQEVVCAGSNRKGLLCGDCLEGKGTAVNFNGIRPVCVNCEEGLSKVGILVWILSEWFPMFAFMFVLMLFNIDLVSGRFNSFLLFAQLLAFSSIRGDAELGAVHNAFVRIYRFLYGMWNLDFFGVLLPPYCLTPHAHLTLLQTLLLHYSIGLFPLTVAIIFVVLERSAEKWICCYRVDQCLRRMRRWKAKYSGGIYYDRSLPAFVILTFTRFLVSSSYILVNQIITGEDGERKVVVWWQGSVPYGSIQHIAYFIPAIVILLVFVLLPSFLLLTLSIVPQPFDRLIIAVPLLRKLQRMQNFCNNINTERWVYHFVSNFQGCYKMCFRSFSSLYLFHRIIHLLVAVFIPRTEDALCVQIILTVALLLLIATCQPYNLCQLNNLDAAILGNLTVILILALRINDLSTPFSTRQFYASIQMILIYLPLLYPGILLGRKLYLKCRQLKCCQKQEEQREDNAEPLLEAPAERLGNLVLLTELHDEEPTPEDEDAVSETGTKI